MGILIGWGQADTFGPTFCNNPVIKGGKTVCTSDWYYCTKLGSDHMLSPTDWAKCKCDKFIIYKHINTQEQSVHFINHEQC